MKYVKRSLKLVLNYLNMQMALLHAVKKRGKIQVGFNSKISKKSNIYCDGQYIKIGRMCILQPYSILMLYGGYIEIGDYVSINPFTILYGHGGLKIGNNVMIASHVTIIPANHNFSDVTKNMYDQGETKKGIIINDDVWLGTGVKILDGVTIGKGCVVGAGAVVTRSLPDYSIATGVPAKVIKYRLKH